MSDLRQLYQQVILDHAKERYGNAPLNGIAGVAHSGSSHQLNPTCGDEITVEAVLDPATGQVDYRWDGDGCSISMASASVLAELIEDGGLAEFEAAESAFYDLMHSRGQESEPPEVLGDAVAFAGVSKFPARIKCALLAWVAAKDALLQAQR